MHERPMGMDNGMGINYESGVRLGGGAKGENGTLVKELTIKK